MTTTRRDQKNNSESVPLLEVKQQTKSQYATGESASLPGRGKLRFAVRKQLQLQQLKKAGGGTYKSIFSSSKHRNTKQVNEDSSKKTYSKLYSYLNPRSRSSSAFCFQQFITLVIIVDVIFYIVSTEPEYEGMQLFYHVECVTSSIFLVEYISRLYVSTEHVSL